MINLKLVLENLLLPLHSAGWFNFITAYHHPWRCKLLIVYILLTFTNKILHIIIEIYKIRPTNS